MDLKQLTTLKEAAERANRAAERAAGRRDTLLARLKAEFGVETVKQGRKLADKWRGEGDAAEKEYAAKLEAFLTEYGDLLGK